MFFTATCLNWNNLLQRKEHKDIIMDSLNYLVQEEQVKVYAFVIMHNHIHIIWKHLRNETKDKIQHKFLKFTAQQLKRILKLNYPIELEKYWVNLKDREYQFWQRNSLSVELGYEDIFKQKLDYIHANPVKAEYSDLPEEYYYSSAKFYETNLDEFGFLTHYGD